MKDWRMHYHLMPPDGWLNDPNGLCRYQGEYHIFFQYSPNAPGPDGRKARTWGHYAGPSLTELSFRGVPFWPVDPVDHDGCYSGSALVEDDGIRLYYTGNVKLPGDHDYTYSGRQANEILVETDGEHFGAKQTVLVNADYPSDCTCHVRDPKVWKENGKYYMVLGARVAGPDHKAETDHGEVLLYVSEDGKAWKFAKTQQMDERFGYMWECPDYFSLDGENFLGICPQGVASEEFRFQNIYESGYFRVDGGTEENQHLHDFQEWDNGFDFYAPQTFEDGTGRRLLIGWVGMPDAPYRNATADCDPYWENCLTVPRALRAEGGRIYQTPAEELTGLRGDPLQADPEGQITLPDGAGDIIASWPEKPDGEKIWKIIFGNDDAVLTFSEGVLSLQLSEKAGCGRTIRKCRTGDIHTLRILADTSILEIYINDGAYVMTTRFYPDYAGTDPELTVRFEGSRPAVSAWAMQTMQTNILY